MPYQLFFLSSCSLVRYPRHSPLLHSFFFSGAEWVHCCAIFRHLITFGLRLPRGPLSPPQTDVVADVAKCLHLVCSCHIFHMTRKLSGKNLVWLYKQCCKHMLHELHPLARCVPQHRHTVNNNYSLCLLSAPLNNWYQLAGNLLFN